MAADPMQMRASSACNPSSRSVATLADLADIFDAGVNLCILQRRLAADVATCATAALSHPVSINQVVAAEAPGWTTLLGPLARLPGFDAFVADVALLASAYTDLLGPDALGVRLHRLTGPMCPRLHVDRVGVRLLCTYAGPGTEWLDDPTADRSRLGPGSGGLPDESSGLIRNTTLVRAIAPGAVALLKGEAFPGNAGGGVIHRSPIDKAPRLLFSLDAVWK